MDCHAKHTDPYTHTSRERENARRTILGDIREQKSSKELKELLEAWP